MVLQKKDTLFHRGHKSTYLGHTFTRFIKSNEGEVGLALWMHLACGHFSSTSTKTPK